MKTELKHISRPIIPIVFMRKNLLKIGAALLLSGGAIFPVATVNAAQVALVGHVPSVVAHLTAESALPATNNLTLAIGLPLHNTDVLSNLLQQIYDPSSTNYHKYLTPEQFTARFGPTEQDYQTVINFAQSNGLMVTGTYSNRVLLNVNGKVSDIQKAFHVTLHKYRHPIESRDFYAPDTDPALDTSLPIIHVSGLDNYFVATPSAKIMPSSQSVGAKPNLGSATGGAYEGKDFRNAYVPGTTLTGAGQNVALFQLDGFFSSDIAAYASEIGLTNPPPLVIVPVDGGVPNPNPNSLGVGEVSLDIEMVLSMSPGVSNIYVYEGPNASSLSIYTIFEDIFSRMASDNLAKQIGCSWFIRNGPPDPVAEQIFQQMALQGQTFFCASGDFDAFPGSIPFPLDSPHITLVGGTTLSTTGPAGSYTSETVWNWGVEFAPNGDGQGSSGGVSATYSIPTWQTNINFATSLGSTTFRNTPDVSMTGDNVWVIYGAGQRAAFGGTSCAAPLWAGYTALINQQAKINGHAPVGFLNPALYTIASGTNYTNCFHDVITGNNTWSGSPNLYYATNNYDLATGLGSPNGTNLINALTGVNSPTNPITHISAPLPPYGSTMSALNGGNPNGTWELFVQDDTPIDSGIISNGWSITLTMASPVGSAADSAVAMTSSASFVPVGSTVTYSITVTNYGPTASTNVIVSDALPSSGATYVSANATMGSVNRSGSTLNWNVGAIASGAGAQLTLTLQANAAGNLVNYAIVSSDTSDPNPDDNIASSTVVVGTQTPPQLSGSASSNGGGFQFTVTGQSGQEYIIQASTNLINWTPIYTNPAPYTSPFDFVDPNATNYLNRFYRVVTGP